MARMRYMIYAALFIVRPQFKKNHIITLLHMYYVICRSYAVVGHTNVETILMKIHEAQIKRKVRKSVHPAHNTKNMKCNL